MKRAVPSAPVVNNARSSTVASGESSIAARGKSSRPRLPLAFLGLGNDARTEHADLRRATGNTAVRLGDDGRRPVRIGGRNLVLDAPQTVDLFIGRLTHDAERTSIFRKIFAATPVEARDEIAALAWAFHRSEQTGSSLQRLIISGHSSGESVSGDGQGSVSMSAIESIARLYPKAAKKLRHVMFATCSSGGDMAARQWAQAFPEIRTIWFYNDKAPSIATGALHHARIWEGATAEFNATEFNPTLFLTAVDKARAATPRGDQLAVWTRESGYNEAPAQRKWFAKPTKDLVKRYFEPETRALFTGHLKGQFEVRDLHGYSPARELYTLQQRLLDRVDLSAELRALVTTEKEQTIRFIYFDHSLKRRIAEHNAADLKLGYSRLRESVPRFARMTRAQILAETRRVRELGTSDLSNLLDNTFVQLRSEKVPLEWI
ncbi:MAG: hypothetical protein H7Z43_10135 [Clostridia bacterium]|nr:hypothetical protein [Deltaproteobacteria bacterium]